VRWAIGAVPIKPALSGGTNVTTFSQAPVFCKNFTLPASGIVTVTNYVNVTSGSMPANPSITAALKYGGNTILTLTGQL